eukprot:scaffold1446_cov175-Ochromonas_danica.AAC.25
MGAPKTTPMMMPAICCLVSLSSSLSWLLLSRGSVGGEVGAMVGGSTSTEAKTTCSTVALSKAELFTVLATETKVLTKSPVSTAEAMVDCTDAIKAVVFSSASNSNCRAASVTSAFLPAAATTSSPTYSTRSTETPRRMACVCRTAHCSAVVRFAEDTSCNKNLEVTWTTGCVCTVGLTVGLAEGASVGTGEGKGVKVGTAVEGDLEGRLEGSIVGKGLGRRLGVGEGAIVMVGEAEDGALVGTGAVGDLVGERDGRREGCRVVPGA